MHSAYEENKENSFENDNNQWKFYRTEWSAKTEQYNINKNESFLNISIINRKMRKSICKDVKKLEIDLKN